MVCKKYSVDNYYDRIKYKNLDSYIIWYYKQIKNRKHE